MKFNSKRLTIMTVFVILFCIIVSISLIGCNKTSVDGISVDDISVSNSALGTRYYATVNITTTNHSKTEAKEVAFGLQIFDYEDNLIKSFRTDKFILNPGETKTVHYTVSNLSRKVQTAKVMSIITE